MLKRRKPRTPGQRHTVRIKVNTEGGMQSVPLNLRKGKMQKSGRNQTGRITVRHRGGGKKRLLRVLLSHINQPMLNGNSVVQINENKVFTGEVIGIQYDPNRTARLALVKHHSLNSTEKGHQFGYVIAAEGLKVGQDITYAWSTSNAYQYHKSTAIDRINTTNEVNLIENQGTTRQIVEKGNQSLQVLPSVGSTRKLSEIPVGSSVFNIELTPGKGGKYVRSAGTFARLLRKPDGRALLRLPSGTRIQVSLECTATVGRVAGEEHRIEVIGKAGRMRNKGWRPTVRGEAINPIDHPHGGRTRGGRPEYTPWSRFAKGKPTRNPKKKSRWVVLPSS